MTNFKTHPPTPLTPNPFHMDVTNVCPSYAHSKIMIYFTCFTINFNFYLNFFLMQN